MNTKPTVLLVEDHHPTADITVEYLSNAGFDVLLSSSLNEARGHLRRAHIDLAVLDVHLPDGDSFELLEELHRTGKDFPTLIVSGDDRAKTRDRAFDVGGSGFLKKPVNPEHLIRAVQELLNETATPA